MLQLFSHRLILCAILICPTAAITGCGGKDIPAKTVLTDQDKQQIQEYQKQATDEWGKPIK